LVRQKRRDERRRSEAWQRPSRERAPMNAELELSTGALGEQGAGDDGNERPDACWECCAKKPPGNDALNCGMRTGWG
jgi:hypothetical protein